MKKIHYIFIALACSLFTACMDGDWDEPSYDNGAPFGNNELTEEGLTTIAELKTQFKSVIDGGSYAQITNDVKIKATVTGNDLGGNIYKQFALQDETGAIIVAVNQNGLNGFLAEGQEIIVDLKGLYVGGYGSMAEIGTPYNGSIGRMSKDLWATHYKIVGGLANINPDAIAPTDFSTIVNDLNQAGKLVVLKNVHFASANGTKRLIDGTASGGNYFSQQLKEFGSNVIVRTSSYADFAAMVMPTGACDITGIATRYNSTWQIMIRKTSDIKVVSE